MASEEDCSTRNVTWRRDRSLRKVGFAAAYPGGATVTATAAVREVDAHPVGRHRDRADLALGDEREQLGEREVPRRLTAAAHAEEHDQRDGDAPGGDDEGLTGRRAA